MPRFDFAAVVVIEAEDADAARRTAQNMPQMVEWRREWGPYLSEAGKRIESRALDVAHNPQQTG